MSISTFFSPSTVSTTNESNWFRKQANKSAPATAVKASTAGKQGEIAFLLNSIGSLYSVPYLLFQKGYSYEEIAVELDLPVGAVKSRVFTARVKMKHLIAQRRRA